MGLGNFVDQAGVTRLRASGGGGGSVPITRQELSGNAVSIADGDGAWLTWDSDGGPDVLLDRSVPAHPTIITAGVYLVSVVARVGPLSPDGYFLAGLYLDRTGFNASMTVTSDRARLAPATEEVGDLSLAFAWYVPAGGEVAARADLVNNGGFAQDFAMAVAHVQRLS